MSACHQLIFPEPHFEDFSSLSKVEYLAGVVRLGKRVSFNTLLPLLEHTERSRDPLEFASLSGLTQRTIYRESQPWSARKKVKHFPAWLRAHAKLGKVFEP